MRGLTDETPVISMQNFYYNFVRPHSSLEGETPSQESGIGIKEKDKWLGLIKKSLPTRNGQP